MDEKNTSKDNLTKYIENPEMPPGIRISKTILILFGALLLAIGLIGGYYFSQSQSSKTNTNSQISPSLSPKITQKVADATANWKTYKNEEYGFEFKYPGKDLEVIDCPRGSVDTTFVVPTIDKRHYDPCQSSGGNFYITKQPSNFKLPEFYYNDYKIKEMADILVGDVGSTKFVGSRKDNDPAPVADSFTTILIPRDAFTLQITLDMWGTTGSLESKYFDQILSTFKFDSNSVSDLSDFETTDVVVRNTFFGGEVMDQSVNRYTFKYPSKDVSSVDMLSDASSNVSGISIKLNNGVDLTIKPAFEGNSVSYNDVDGKPSVKKINNPNLVGEITRILGVSSYSYVAGYGEGATGCSHWDPLPLACHMSNAGFDKIGGYEIICNTKDISKVKMCDDIVGSLAISVEKIK